MTSQSCSTREQLDNISTVSFSFSKYGFLDLCHFSQVPVHCMPNTCLTHDLPCSTETPDTRFEVTELSEYATETTFYSRRWLTGTSIRCRSFDHGDKRFSLSYINPQLLHKDWVNLASTPLNRRNVLTLGPLGPSRTVQTAEP